MVPASGVAPAVAAPLPPASACGPTAVLKADGSPWVCTFADDFSASTLDLTKWTPQLTATSGFDQNNTCFTDSSRNLAVSKGILSLTSRKSSWASTCTSPKGSFRTKYSSGMVSTYTKFTQAYGRFEFRAKFSTSKQPGIQSALWLYPEVPGNVWPFSGEIDIAEWYSKYYDRVIPFLHYGGTYADAYATNNHCLVPDVGGTWHTYVLEWTPASISFIYDNQVCLTNTTASGKDPFNKAYMVALTQLIGSGANEPTSRTPGTNTMQVDYVRVYS
ncbi:MAG: glycoside hydrolase family 16 protein [Propionibacteriales bacterium]|nr:glycoside hydrolase family 16 protein [Propionibacteriales bacterium]